MPRDRAAIGSPLKMTYKFDVTQPISSDFVVFVHVLDDQGDSLWGDDHQPPQPTSTWKPGQKIEYTRTIFVQNYPYIGPAHVRVGLYQPSSSQRLPLCNTELARQEYEVLKFQLLPQSENIFLIYKDGWHPAEVAPDNATVEWQWTKKAATISFKNPRKDATFYLEFDARIDQVQPGPAGHHPLGQPGHRDVRGRLEDHEARLVPGDRGATWRHGHGGDHAGGR